MYPQAEVGGDAPRQPRSRAVQVHDHRARSVIAGINYPWTIYAGPRQLRLRLRPQQVEQPRRRHRASRRGARGLRGDGGGGHRRDALVRVHRRPRRQSSGRATARSPALRRVRRRHGRRARDRRVARRARCAWCSSISCGSTIRSGASPLDRHGASAFLDRVLDPFLDRYGQRDCDSFVRPDQRAGLGDARARDRSAVEPSGRSIACGRSPECCRHRIHAQSRALSRSAAAGSQFAREWDDPAYGLDFVQVHSYPDVRYPDRDDSVFGRTAASFGLSKPLLIGECPSHPRAHPPGSPLAVVHARRLPRRSPATAATSARGRGASRASMHSVPSTCAGEIEFHSRVDPHRTSGDHRPLISIVAPVYNEAATLPEFVRRIAAVCDALQSRYSERDRARRRRQHGTARSRSRSS